MTNPSVSIIVITYNSSKYVLETLESVIRQTYTDLELIISDDCSTDNTVDLCKNFIEKHQDIPFVKEAKIVSTAQNAGIVANYNNGLKYATGEWIKYIAGDDILINDSIRVYMEETKKTADKFFIAGIIIFTDQGKMRTEIPPSVFGRGSAKRQLKRFVYLGSRVFGPTIFIERKTLIELGGFDEKYPMIEDLPISVKFIVNNRRIHLIEQALVKWRDYDESVSHQGKGMHSSLDLHYDNEIRAHLKEWGFYLAYFHDSLGMFMKKRQNHPFYGNWIVRLGVKFIDPVAWHDWYWKKIKKFRYLLKPY